MSISKGSIQSNFNNIEDYNSIINVLDPQDGSLVGTVKNNTISEAKLIIETAVLGAKKAKALSAHERMTVLNQVAESLKKQKELFAQMISREGVKTITESRKEVLRCFDTLRISAEEARRLTGETISFDQALGSENRFGYYRRIPCLLYTSDAADE